MIRQCGFSSLYFPFSYVYCMEQIYQSLYKFIYKIQKVITLGSQEIRYFLSLSSFIKVKKRHLYFNGNDRFLLLLFLSDI